MNQEAEQLRLLSIFHFIVAGLAALFSFFPLIYSILGGFLVYAAHHPGPGNQEPPPALVGWIFVVLGALFFVAGIAMAICIFAAARSLARCKHYSFALVIACIECLFVPFGTILGVFTIVTLSRESVRTMFTTAQDL